jgi:UDP-N-acetylmuramate dehydrogenase
VSARAAAFVADIRATVRGEVREAEPLSRYSTYRIGGPATMLFPQSVEDISAALRLAGDRGVGWFALGLGSNVLLPDEGLDALVIRLGKGLDAIQADGDRWRLGGGLPAPLAARRTAEAGWGGLHQMIGVPGSVGGGVFMNAGCHGTEWADVLEWATVVDACGTVSRRARADIPFVYRHSGLDDTVVVEAEVRLRSESPERLTQEVNDLFRWRQQGTPFNKPCCGSVFRNPVTPPAPNLRTAGQLIDGAGLKGFSIGAAQVSPMHANYIINTGGATARQVRATMEHVRDTVRERYGVELQPEVKIVEGNGRVTRVGD